MKQEHNLKLIEAKIGFLSDRTRCVCREKGKPYQIHHMKITTIIMTKTI